MAGPAVQHLEMHVGAGADCEPFEEVVHEFGLQIADLRDLHLEIDDGVRPPAEIDRGDGERLVHRHYEIAGAVDAFARAQRLRHRFAERDAEILDGVMLIDVEVAAGGDPEIERAMPGDEFQHVVEETDPGPHRVPTAAVEAERQRDLRLGGLAIDYRAAHSTSSITATARLVCSTTPVAMRRQPAHPGSVERSRR